VDKPYKLTLQSIVRSRVITGIAIILAVTLVGCRYRRIHNHRRVSTVRQAAALDAGQAHDPAHPPIDCPLHKGGVDPTHMRPFEDVEKYIAFLERPERAMWQKPDDVVAALGLSGGETLVDVGSGSGYFAFRFARVLQKGKVVAEDTEPEMVRHVHHRAMTEGISNIQSVLIKPDAPEVSADADWVFICDVLHHVPEQPAWLGRVVSGMKSGARLALIEFKEGKLPEGPPESMKIPRAQLLSRLTSAGLAFERESPSLLPYQIFLVFRKP
jgi:SAM-dependent methyltransferase